MDDVKQVIDQVANARQVISVLSIRLRRDLSDSAQHAIDLEGAAARAVGGMKRLQPDDKQNG